MFVQVTAKNVGGVFFETHCNCFPVSGIVCCAVTSIQNIAYL